MGSMNRCPTMDRLCPTRDHSLGLVPRSLIQIQNPDLNPDPTLATIPERALLSWRTKFLSNPATTTTTTTTTTTSTPTTETHNNTSNDRLFMFIQRQLSTPPTLPPTPLIKASTSDMSG